MMKCENRQASLCSLLLAACLNLTFGSLALGQSAERLLRDCESVQPGMPAGSDATAFPSGSGGGECWHFMAATLQYARLANDNGMRLPTACPVPAAGISDAIQTFVGYARAHPEKLQLKAAEVAYEAMREAFPCKDASETASEQSSKPGQIATSLRLRFDESGKAHEIDSKNLNWYVVETEGPGIRVNAPFYGDCPDGEQPFVYRPWLPPPANAGSANNLEPGYCLQKSKNLVFVLSFERPIWSGRIKLSAHGTRIPQWDGQLLSKQLAVISIRAGLKDAELEITLSD